jgi:lysophospholipase L1-like esterase
LSVQISIGQPVAIPQLAKVYPFVNEEVNVISNSEHLSCLMERLYELRKGGKGSVNILHIGDSHLQADFVTSVIRTTLQKSFGNGGRGLVVPYRIAKTNEPFNYRWASTFQWQSKRCVFPNQPLPIGIGGVTITTADSCADFTIRTNDDSLLNYSFNKVTMFYQKDSASYSFALLDSLGSRIGTISNDTTDYFPFTSSAMFQSPVNRMTVQVFKTGDYQSKATIFGLLLGNGEPGIVYNTIGVNGAQFQNYAEAAYFSEQTPALKPDLIIFSLGTNEGYALNFNQEKFYADIQSLYQQLKEKNPEAGFLFTVPAGSYRRKKPNPRMVLAGKTVIGFAAANNCSCWDLQGVTGGANSALNWRKNHLLRADGVHFTRAGYELQGNLFCKAFLNVYNTYVANRPE